MEKATLSKELKSRIMNEIYKEDTLKLQHLLEKDISYWWGFRVFLNTLFFENYCFMKHDDFAFISINSSIDTS